MLEPHASPDVNDAQVESLESTGFSGENIRPLVTMDAPPDYEGKTSGEGSPRLDEIMLFRAGKYHIDVAEYRIGVLSADLSRHLFSLDQRIRIRDAETQAKLSIADVESILSEVLLARETLFAIVEAADAVKRAAAGNVPDASKTAAEQSAANDENAKRVCDILDQMEDAGEFSGLSDDAKEVARQAMGLALRKDME